MDIEQQREYGKQGGLTRRNAMTPEERSLQASHAATVRAAMNRLLGVYPRKGTDLKRVEWYLRSLSRLLGKAIYEDDRQEARKLIAVMLGAERLKIMLTPDAVKNAKSAMLELPADSITPEVQERLKRVHDEHRGIERANGHSNGTNGTAGEAHAQSGASGKDAGRKGAGEGTQAE